MDNGRPDRARRLFPNFTTVRGVVLVLFMLLASDAVCQDAEEVELLHADALEGDQHLGPNVFRLTGNVQFRHNRTLMSCDSAYRYNDENRFEAFGRIHINRGDTVHAYGRRLLYDGNTGIARLFDDVSMTDGTMRLETPQLDYNTTTNVSHYAEGGVLTDRENRLTSRRGYYFGSERAMYFKDSVVLVNPRYVVECDTLRYDPPVATATFLGPTTIESTGEDSTFIYCEYGWYNTTSEKSYFAEKSFIQARHQRLSGDSLLYDNRNGIGNAFRDVLVHDLDNDILIHGDRAQYFDRARYSLVTGHTLFTRVFSADSLFLHADTLHAVWDSVSREKTYFAYHHVRLFKSDMQGKCDSLGYAPADSLITMLGAPVLWSEENQMTADSIFLQTRGSAIDRLFLRSSAFVTSEMDPRRYNQVRGKNMTGLFRESKLYRIDVDGNGQAVYHTTEGEGESRRITGVNRAECSDMAVMIEENKVREIRLYTLPAGTLFPIRDVQPADMMLKGFSWQAAVRPVSKEDIFVWR